MSLPTVPYSQYRYLVSLQSPLGDNPLGGFSELSAPNVPAYGGVHTVNDVTLKRGLVDSSDLWNWISSARATHPKAQRDVIITLRDEANNPVQTYKLSSATPKKYVGPTLNGKGSGDVAIEELVLASEDIIIDPRP